MVDRPIIFSGPMVRALLAGRKTQTRRLAKFIEPRGEQFHVHSKAGGWFGPEARVAEVAPEHARYAKGDRLYLREAWRSDYASEGWRDDLGRVAKRSDFDSATTGTDISRMVSASLAAAIVPACTCPARPRASC